MRDNLIPNSTRPMQLPLKQSRITFDTSLLAAYYDHPGDSTNEKFLLALTDVSTA